ncbi:MAG: potassium-transporting ATPase subunit KdpA [Candidatus Limnocylindrales bacterium]
MNPTAIVTAASLFLAVTVIAPILGRYMFDVFEGRRVILSPVLRPVERSVYRLARVDETSEQGWKTYAVSVLAFSFVSVLVLYVLQRVQGALPLNQAGMGPVEELLSFHTAASFVTNTNWQNYAGESTMTHLTQAAGLAVQNFVSAATGIAVAIALTRGLVRRTAATIGNFWVDLTRATVYVLLPIAFVAALILVWQGVIQTWAGPGTITTLEGAQQTIALGPVASQESIKELGNNGGGFLNANSAHPFESPTGLTNWFEMLLILIIPFGLTSTFGRYAKDRRQGWTIFAAMFLVLVVGSGVAMGMEANGNALLAGTDQAGLGNMEGKEVRFGAAAGGLFAAVTTGTSTGAVNAAHSSLTPIGGLVPLFNMLLGEVTPGGAGAGLYGMLVFAILAVFIAGLMVGRTPEYLGKKIEPFEMKMAMLVILILATSVLGYAALGTIIEPGEAGGPGNGGPHAFSEVLYAFASQTGNNGSAFGSLTGNVPFYNLAGGFAVLIGRFGMIIPILAIAGSMAAKRRVAPSLGTFPTTGPIFVGLLIGVVIIVGALTYFPALALGPIVEQFLLDAGKAF